MQIERTSRALESSGFARKFVWTQNVNWSWLQFDELTPRVTYELLRLRQNIFVVEQGVPYSDIDGKDFACQHLLAQVDGDVVAGLRLLPKDLFEVGFFSFGRVVVRENMRRSGLGRELVYKGIERLDGLRGPVPIKISSQLYLENFYKSFGFEAKSAPYIEDQILHIEMTKE